MSKTSPPDAIGVLASKMARPRFTKDLDVWVEPTLDNARRVLGALRAFGAPVADLDESDLSAPGADRHLNSGGPRRNISQNSDQHANPPSFRSQDQVEPAGGED